MDQNTSNFNEFELKDVNSNENSFNLERDYNNEVLSVYRSELAKQQEKLAIEDLYTIDQQSAFDFGENKVSTYGTPFDYTEAFSTKLSDGSRITRYDDFLSGADNEQRHADRQSTGEKWLNGLGKFVGKTINNTVGGVVGMGYGFISAIGNGNIEKIYDNDFVDMLDDYNTKMDNFAANYRTQEERDMNFFEKANPFGEGFSNFIADDFLGGMSFLAGTVLSEGIWAAATGGASLSTTFGRMALRSAKAMKTANAFLKGGTKAATKVGKQFLRKEVKKYGVSGSVKKIKEIDKLYATGKLTEQAARKAKNWAKAGEAINMLRFTYTSAGFESGMEARLYQREQRENFYKDFEELNGRKPTAQEINEFEKNLNTTTNGLFAINMALVGTSDFAILGKTFGITSPFKTSSKQLNKVLYGTGVNRVVNKAGEKVATAITRNNLQRTLGFTKGLLKNPVYEGIIEEGGQATFSTAMESYLTSRYNPNKEVIDIVEATYDGLAHTYGTKEGWNEVGLGMLIGFVGGEVTSKLSGNKWFQEARDGGNKQDGRYYKIHKETGKKEEIKEEEYNNLYENKTEEYEIVATGSVGVAENMNKNSGTNVVSRIFGSGIENSIGVATELQNANTLRETAEGKGDLNGIRTADAMIMATSVQNAINNDYLEDQIEDFQAALELQGEAKEGEKSVLAEHFGIEQSEVDGQITKMVNAYKKLAEKAEKYQSFAEYMISDNSKEFMDKGKINPVDIQMARNAVAYQMIMTDFYEDNMGDIHQTFLNVLKETNESLYTRYKGALDEYHRLRQVKPELVQEKNKVEQAIDKLRREEERLNDKAMVDREGTINYSAKIQKIADKRNELQQQLNKINEEINIQDTTSKSYDQISDKAKRIAAELDGIDPISSSVDGFVEAKTVKSVLQDLEGLERAIKENNSPEGTEKLLNLSQQYHKAMEMWERNAKTLQDLTDPELGLKRVGHVLTRKKQAGTTTLEFLKRLQQTKSEEQKFAKELQQAMSAKDVKQEAEGKNPLKEKSNQEIVNEDDGQDVTKKTKEEVEAELQQEISKLEQKRKEELSLIRKKSKLPTLTVEEIEKQRKRRLENPNTGDTIQSINEEFDTLLKINSYKNTKQSRKEINKKYDKRIKDLKEKSNQEIVNEEAQTLEEKLKELLLSNSYFLFNDNQSVDSIIKDKKPTVEDIEEYHSILENFTGDRRKLIGRPVEQIGKRAKGGLSDAQVQRIQELSGKFEEWRLIVGTELDGVSVMDILEKIEFLKTEANPNINMTSEEQIENSDKTEKSLGGRKNYNIGQNFDYVKIHIDGEHIVLSHLVGNKEDGIAKDSHLIENGFLPTGETVEVVQKNQKLYMKRYSKAVGETVHDIFVGPNNNVLIPIKEGQGDQTLKELKLDRVHYSGTIYGTVYNNGEAMKSGIKIEDESIDGQKLNSNKIYELKPGDKLKFSFSLTNKHSQEQEHKLIEEGLALEKQGEKEKAKQKYEEAKQNMVIYIRTENGEVVQYLKAGKDNTKDSNFNKVRDKAFEVLKNTLSDPFAQLDNDSIVDIGLETTVKKFFIGSPNFVLENGKIKNFPILPEQRNQVTKIGYGNRESAEKEGIRVAFLPKDKNVAYVVLEQFDTKIAYPVTLTPSREVVVNSIQEILNDSKLKANIQKENALIKLLKLNGVDPGNFNLEDLQDNPQELEKITDSIVKASKFFTQNIIKEAEENKEKTNSLLESATLTVDLNNPVAISPKVVMNLNEKDGLLNVETGEKSSPKPKTILELQEELITQDVLIEIGKIEKGLSATIAEVEILKVVEKLNDSFKNEYHNNKKFARLVYEIYKKGPESVPSVATEEMVENNILDQVDTNEEGIPADTNNELNKDVEEVKKNPSEFNIKSLAKKLINVIRNQFVLVPKELKGSTKHLYHIPTNETDQKMFEKGFVKIYHNFYKKVKKVNRQHLIDRLYEKYKNGNLSKEYVDDSFYKVKQARSGNKVELMPVNEFNRIVSNLTDLELYQAALDVNKESLKSKIIKKFVNQQPANSNYLKEDFKRDFESFVVEEMIKNSDLYNEVLKHINTQGTSLIADNLDKAILDKFKESLGNFYQKIIDYSLINKHIDLGVEVESIIFVEDLEQAQDIEAVNNYENLPILNSENKRIDENTIRANQTDSYIYHDGYVYKNTNSNKQGKSTYMRLASIDSNFLVYNISQPFDGENIDSDTVENTPIRVVKRRATKVFHHTRIKADDFDFSNFKRENQISQFGNGLSVSTDTTNFLKKRYGDPIVGEVIDEDFIEIDVNKTEKELYEDLISKGYKFSNKYESEDKMNNIYDITMFNDFQENNDVAGVKVVNHKINNTKVSPFYVIYKASSFYGEGSINSLSEQLQC